MCVRVHACVRVSVSVSATADGGVYTGDFRKGKREGFGIYVYADQSRYEGNWVDDMMVGVASLCKHHLWVVCIAHSRRRLSHSYGGGRQTCVRHSHGDDTITTQEGQGKYFYVNNRNFYDGPWKNDAPHGMGENSIDSLPSSLPPHHLILRVPYRRYLPPQGRS